MKQQASLLHHVPAAASQYTLPIVFLLNYSGALICSENTVCIITLIEED